VIRSGDMCAVMGPSGAGKTTLLDVLAKRKTEGKVLGAVYFDGRAPSKSSVMKHTAYIQQQDCFFGGATVRETILFASQAKLPGGGREASDRKRVATEQVIRQLDLGRCADTYMGNRLIRGVSGGEMKRTAVACALLCSPRCMFLDEPTSGLDSAMARETVARLDSLRRERGCTFVVTIHQPAPAVYDTFESLVLLDRGEVVYWGPGRGAPLEFFAEQGFPYVPGHNVAEFLIDAIAEQRGGGRSGGAGLDDACGDESGDANDETSSPPSSLAAHDFGAHYRRSDLHAANAEAARRAIRRGRDGGGTEDSGSADVGSHSFASEPGSKFANGALRELYVLLRYKGLPRVKHPLFVTTRLCLYVLLAGLLSSFFYGQDKNLTGIFNSVGVLFITVILPCFMAQVFVEEMKFDREVYTREFNDAYYRAGTYVAHRCLVELPMLALSALSFAAILYPSVGFRLGTNGGSDAPTTIGAAGPAAGAETMDGLALSDDSAGSSFHDGFAFFVLACTVNFSVATLLGFSIAASIRGEVGPAVFLPVFTTLHMLVGGFWIRKATMHAAWTWLYWISFIQWTWAALMSNEYRGAAFYDHCRVEGGGGTGGATTSFVEAFGGTAMPLTEGQRRGLELYALSRRGRACEPLLGDQVLASFELERRNRWTCLGYAACSVPVFLLTFYLGVRFVKHERR